jgi:histidinol-phosphatase (PHP family)
MWANYHSHTHYCDGSSPAEEYIKAAIANNMVAYGYSSHSPVPFPSDWNIPPKRITDYLSDVNQVKKTYSSQIEIYSGLEVDYIPGLAGRHSSLLHNVPLDFFIGSIHYVGQFADGSPWNIDTSRELFLKGLQEIYGNAFRKASAAYYENTCTMLREDKPDVLGHMDKIKMFNTNNALFREDETWYVRQVTDVLRTQAVAAFRDFAASQRVVYNARQGSGAAP